VWHGDGGATQRSRASQIGFFWSRMRGRNVASELHGDGKETQQMTTALLKRLPLAVLLLTAASGCEFIDFDAASVPPTVDIELGDGGGPKGPAPLYPFRPGSTWQYTVTALDGSQYKKFVAIDAKQVMVGGSGPHQLELAYPVRTSAAPGGQASMITMQQVEGNRIVNYREQTLDQLGQTVLEINWDPQQLEVDQSNERTRPGVSWLESYSGDVRHQGGMVSFIRRSETWRVVGEEVLALPGVEKQFQTIVFQLAPAAMGTDAGAGPADAGKTGDAAPPPPPTLTAQTWSEAADAGAMMPKTLWYARGYGKVKEAGGGEPMEELSGLELK
jgi:hypothetical protein